MAVWSRRAWMIVAVSFVTSSCSDEMSHDAFDAATDATDDGGLAGVSVELGTGQSAWEPLPRSNGQLELIYGVQGGYHVWGRMHVRGFEPDVDVNYSAIDLTTGRTLRTDLTWSRRRFVDSTAYGLAPIGGGTFESDAELVVLSIECANEVVGHQLQVRVLVRERTTQRIASDTRTALVVDTVNPTACAMH